MERGSARLLHRPSLQIIHRDLPCIPGPNGSGLHRLLRLQRRRRARSKRYASADVFRVCASPESCCSSCPLGVVVVLDILWHTVAVECLDESHDKRSSAEAKWYSSRLQRGLRRSHVVWPTVPLSFRLVLKLSGVVIAFRTTGVPILSINNATGHRN